MKRRYDERFENDTTPSREIARRYREAFFDEDRDASLAVLHYRGGEEEFLLGREYSESDDAADRATGADILAQLGWGDKTFHDESINILTELLDDSDVHVLYCAAVGLGHRSAESAIPRLLKHINHSDSLVRYGVVLGLSGYENDSAISGLIQLAGDDDDEVRNWAVFGLGTQIDVDSPQIRETLRSALNDADYEIRGEGLVGLAKRGDAEIVSLLLNEWKNDKISILSIEAAEESRDSRLHESLKEFSEVLSMEDDPYYESKLNDAIEACKPVLEDDVAVKE